MEQKFNYDDFIMEIHGDIYEERLTMDDHLKVVRDTQTTEGYKPVLSYHYSDEEVEGLAEVIKVSNLLNEMYTHNPTNQ